MLTDSDLNQMECLHIDKIIHRSLSCAIERVLFVPPFAKVGPLLHNNDDFFTQNDNFHRSKWQRLSPDNFESLGQSTLKWILAALSQYYMQIANCRSDQSCSSLVFDHSLKNAFQSNILHYERSVYYSRKYEIGLLFLSKILL